MAPATRPAAAIPASPPALGFILRLLTALEADVSYHDPFVAELPELGLVSVDLEAALAASDLAAIVTAHPGIDYANVVAAAPRTLDFRGVTRDIESADLERL